MCKKLLMALLMAICGAEAVFFATWPARRRHCCDTRWAIKNVESALVHFQTENSDACPVSLKAFIDQRILMRAPLDCWGQPLLFVCPGVHNPDGADIVSAGRDHMFGTSDDVRSWEL